MTNPVAKNLHKVHRAARIPNKRRTVRKPKHRESYGYDRYRGKDPPAR